MTSLPRRLAAIATTLLTLAMIAILGLRAIGQPVAVGPTPSPTPMVASPTPGQPTASPAGNLAKALARIENQVSALRALPQPDIGPPDLIDRNQLADELEALLDEDWTPRQLADDNLTLRAMGLLTEQQDIRELTEQLLAGQVLGFYDFEERRMVVVTDAGLTPGARITYAHEFTHAMQDEAFDTGETHGAQAEDDDAALAFLALQEGDAVVSMLQWAFQNLTPEELAEFGATPVPDTTGVWILSPRRVVEHFVHAHDLPASAWPTTRVVNLPGITLTVREMLDRARERDPGGEYLLVPDGDLGALSAGAYDLALSAFTFDNIPTLERKISVLRSLGRLLKSEGRIVNLVSTPEIYVHEWVSFSTKDFPGNRSAKSGDTVRIVMLDVEDRRPVEDILWTEEDYREVYRRAALTPVATFRPLARASEPYNWVSETTIAPWVIDVLAPARAGPAPRTAPEGTA